jgi:hypothetical protein
MRTDTISPVARCTCRHLYRAHEDGLCEGLRARGRCRCVVFRLDDFQPHTETLEVLTAAIRLWGFAPTVREMAQTLGVSSTATMNSRLGVLEDAGLIERVGPRAIRLMEVAE